MSRALKTADDLSRRATYLAEVIDQLYPGPERPAPGKESAGLVPFTPASTETRPYIVVPGRRKPRVLIPAADRKVAAGALARYARPAARGARAKRDAAVWALRLGLDRLLLPHRIQVASAEGIDDHLASVLGHEVHLSIHIGPARANRKPVLQILDGEARTVAFAKLGVNALTRELVEAETTATRRLSELCDLRRLRVPTLLHSGTWRGCNLMVTSALPAWSEPVECGETRRAEGMRELAEAVGTNRSPLGESDYAARLRTRLKQLVERGEPDAETLVAAGTTLLDRYAATELTFGCWHGDWSPWNTCEAADVVYLWDLERFEAGVPYGFDAVHYRLQDDIVTRSADPTTAVLQLVANAPAVLAPMGVAPSEAEPTALLYLVDLAARYMSDRAEQAGAALGALGKWLLPTLLRHIARQRETE
ncbi:hypothetical protein [Glycomyces buryatensis]|uniref:Aminoglycoside phosphotransferase family protein n=1 Tax=Glycomyces buryatensis TaxID=2570927 RepID=A0A4S8QN84_9ACTN|nr:hypothetical protein [Glycomyces buryatensis]THV42909.1 hypothetical protein FAB82_03945 [Glycomyces buryatensis]